MEDKVVLSKAKIMAGGWSQKHIVINGLERKPVYDKENVLVNIQGVGTIKLPATVEELKAGIDNTVSTGDVILDRIRTQFYQAVEELIMKSEASKE